MNLKAHLVVALIALTPLVSAAATNPYSYLEDFESGAAPASSNSITNVPSGTGGVSAGASGGARYGQILRGNNFPKISFSLSPMNPGGWSYQVDFRSKSATTGLQGFQPIVGSDTGVGFLGTYSWVSGGKAQDYYHPVNFTVPASTWLTLEFAFVPGQTLQPSSGKPLYDFLFNVYQQVTFNSDGYRSGQLLYSFRGTYNNFETGGNVIVGNATTPGSIDFVNSSLSTLDIDNVAVGPLINTPEPATVGALLLMLATGAARRRR